MKYLIITDLKDFENYLEDRKLLLLFEHTIINDFVVISLEDTSFLELDILANYTSFEIIDNLEDSIVLNA